MISHPDEYYFTVAEDYRYQGNYERAADAYRRSLAYNDRNALAYFQLAETLGASGGFDGTSYSADELRQAVDAYQTAIDLGFPQAALAYKGMGWAQIALQDYENASRALNEAIESPLLREPGYVWDLANTYEGLAKAFAGQGDDTGAAHYEALARELALNPVTP
ncbi:MAG: tetratricopeptide repeat protein [Anaerolineae bacterium]